MWAPDENNNNAKAVKKWTVRNVELDLRSLVNNGWGVQPEFLKAIIPFLQLENFYDDQAEEKNFRFEHLLAITRFLDTQGIHEVNINDGIKKFLDVQKTTQQRNNIDDDTNYDRAIQEVLIKILSPDSPIRIIADGQWGKQTQSAYEQVVSAYHLQPQNLSRVVLNQLEMIAARMIRLRCNDSMLSGVIERNLFCIIDESAVNFELVKEGLDGCITRLHDKKRLVHFRELLTERNRPALQEFATFSPWFMLLNLEAQNPPGAYGNTLISLYQNSVRGWAPIGELLNLQIYNEFIYTPMYCLRLSKEETSRQGDILFNTKEGEAADIICCVFKADFQLLFVSATQTRTATGGVDIALNLRDVFNQPTETTPKGEAAVLVESNFMKIFVVSSTFKNSLSNILPKKGELPPAFFALVAANENELLATLTVGIEFRSAGPEDTKPREFREIVESMYPNQKIIVPDDIQKRRWGGLSATDGKKLKAAVTNKLPGYYNITITLEIEKNKNKSVTEVAFFLHDSFNEEIRYEPVLKGKAQVKVSGYEAFTVGAYTSDGTMLELDLNEERGYPKGFYYKEVAANFKQEVAELYQSKKVVVENDPQKGRWGGKPIAKGKQLSAEFIQSLLPGIYKFAIRLKSETPGPLKGDVAFFLHDSFTRPIRYKKVKDGEAIITVEAYEDFTVGAYTEDGTMLELDLHNVKGFPQGFYYVDKKGNDENTNIESNA